MQYLSTEQVCPLSRTRRKKLCHCGVMQKLSGGPAGDKDYQFKRTGNMTGGTKQLHVAMCYINISAEVGASWQVAALCSIARQRDPETTCLAYCYIYLSQAANHKPLGLEGCSS